MPMFGDKRDGLSLEIINLMEVYLNEVCSQKNISKSELQEILTPDSVNRMFRNLGLSMKVESASKMLPVGLEFVLPGSPSVIL